MNTGKRDTSQIWVRVTTQGDYLSYPAVPRVIVRVLKRRKRKAEESEKEM